jgi:transposase InsO family protein
MLIVDDYSRWMWIHLLKTKDQACSAFKKTKALAENASNRCIKVLRSDRGGEFLWTELAQVCEEAGIEHQFTAPYSPQQNGVIEHRNRTVMAMACSLLKSMRLQGVLCGEAVRHDTYLLNRLPTKSMGDQTPFEAWSGKKPHLAHLRVFGCVAHAKITTPHLRKLKDHRKMLVYFGIEEGSKAHPLFDPHHKKICVSRDVIFQEHIEWNWNDGASHDGPRDFIEETNTVSPVSSLVPIVSASAGAPVPAAVPMAAPSEGLTSSAASTPLDQPAPGSPSAEPG